MTSVCFRCDFFCAVPTTISRERAAEFGWSDAAAASKRGSGGADMIVEGGWDGEDEACN